MTGAHSEPIRVLVLHASPVFGGMSKSLIELLSAIPPSVLAVSVVCPEGGAAERFRQCGMEVLPVAGLSQFDDTRIGFYRGLRWIVLLRELARLPPTLWALWRLRRRRFDLVHANDLPLAPIGAIAKRLLKAPLVVHARSVQRAAGPSVDRRTKWLFDIVRRHADMVVPIDETVRRSLPADVRTKVIHNTMSVRGTEQRSAPGERLRVGFVGNFLRFKGLYEFLQAARYCRDKGLPVEFVVAGDNTRAVTGVRSWLIGRLGLGHDLGAEVQDYVHSMGLERTVRFTGFVDDVAKIYSNIDVLCFATHLDAVGRPVLEAAFFGVPSIVAIRDPLPDTIVHGETGVCIDSPRPQLIAQAIDHLLKNPAERQRLGEGAKALAQRSFDRQKNAAEMLAIYQDLARSNAARKPRDLQRARLIVHAPNVHVGGGKELLGALIRALEGREDYVAVLDQRFAATVRLDNAIQVIAVRPTLKDRFEAEWKLRSIVAPGARVLCFGNLPPLFRLRGKVYVYLQNRNLFMEQSGALVAGRTLYTHARETLERWWLATRLHNADVIVVQTNAMRALVSARFRRDSIVAPFLPDGKGAANGPVPIDSPRNAFLYVASGDPHKNHQRLVDAWRLLGESGLRPPLWLTIDPARYPRLVERIEHVAAVHGLQITNFGNLSRADLHGLYANAAALVYPSLVESYGLPLLEARAAGLPIITGELDYVRDIVDPEETFDPRSALSIARAVRRFIGRPEQRMPGDDAEAFLRRILSHDA